MNRPGVISYPESVQQLKRGFNTLAELLAATLGPTQGVVLSSTELNPKPELISDSATIARRITELPDPRQNVGAMLLRNMVWRMHERVGDGGALMAVLSQALLSQSLRSVAAGANPVLVLKGIRRATRIALDCLLESAEPVQGEDDLAGVALAVTGEPNLSFILGEMFDLLGSLGSIVIEDYMAPYFERTYLDGGRWQASLISPYLINSPTGGQAVLQDVCVALFDGNLTSAEEVRPVLEAVSQAKPPHLLLAANKISGEALNLLVATNTQTEMKIIAVSLSRVGEKAYADLEDLSWLTGASLVSARAGTSLRAFQPEELGKARRVEANSQNLIVSGGNGDPVHLRAQIEILNRQSRDLPFGDSARPELELRLGRLSGNVGILKIGAYTQVERDYLHQRAAQGIKALRAALEEGVLPGGGAAYLSCIPTVESEFITESEDEAAGMRAVAAALRAPFYRILQNAGVLAPAVALEALQNSRPGMFFNALDKQICDARNAGVLDAAKVLRAALETASSGAAMALSTETLILKKNPKVSYEP